MQNETPTTDNMTWREFVKNVRPELNLSDADAEHVLWEETAFPFADKETVKQQATEYVMGMKP